GGRAFPTRPGLDAPQRFRTVVPITMHRFLLPGRNPVAPPSLRVRPVLAWTESCIRLVVTCGLLLAAAAAFSARAADPAPVVTVTGGQIRGRLLPDGRGAVFKGIPFAQPPVG